jgi:hypothetical protein
MNVKSFGAVWDKEKSKLFNALRARKFTQQLEAIHSRNLTCLTATEGNWISHRLIV